MTLDDFLTLTRNSLRQPDLALRQLQSLDLPMQTRWMALVLVVALSSLLAGMAARMFPVPVETGLSLLTRQPLIMAGAQLFGMALTAWLIANVGRAFGGRGDFADALLVVAWIEFLLVVVQLAQVVLMGVSPLFASAMGMAIIFMLVWLTVNMVKALHGFESAILVFLGVLGTALLTTIFLSVLAGALGLLPEIPAEVQP
ncbi:Yip1 domain-containing protein [Paracoccus isoporae]|uniref:Yip1 domain-containing protein n=1 Tax=Paracoccus isoporae TaxID=591205 RepID=A0A1G7GPG4_9RHOB|nr:YIP1 family protein [Paracoccus isoporae]SDE90004.1 Yip1 domain-containing protein [Paracoccus isoporae]